MFTPKNEEWNDDLEALINLSNANQWSVEDKIDWDQEIIVPEGMNIHDYTDMVSQLFYAEEASVQMCSRLIQQLPELQAKLYICAQAADEARHAQAYRMYVEKLGGLKPVTDDMRIIFEGGLAWDGPAWGLVAAMNVLLEREALAQQKRRIQQLPCPLFTQINEAIVVDESRHCRFGILYLQRVVPTRPLQERTMVYNWLDRLWSQWCKSHVHRYTAGGSNVMHLRQEELEESWTKRKRLFRQLGILQA